MILGSSILAKATSNTSTMPSGRKLRTLLKTVWASYIGASTWNAIMTRGLSTFPCQATSWNNSLVMLTLHLTDHSIAPSCSIPSRTARILKHLRILMTILSLTMLVRNASNKLLVVSFTMHGLLIQQYSWHYPTLPLNKPLLLRTPRSKLTNSLTTCGFNLMQKSATVPPIWFSTFIPMPRISLHLVHAAAPVAISSLVAYPSTATQSSSTAQSTLLAPSSSSLPHPLPKLIRCPLPQCLRSQRSLPNFWQIWASSTSNTHPHQQHHYC